MSVISEAERLKGSPERRYHFAINNISKSALVRDVMVWILLEGVVKSIDADEQEMVLNVVFFV